MKDNSVRIDATKVEILPPDALVLGSIQPTGQWISVKDKSPVVNYPVLVTYDMGEGTHRHTDLGRFTGSEWYLYSDRAFVGHPDMRFLAWQELPAPYEGE